jgi:hypothetical protein
MGSYLEIVDLLYSMIRSELHNSIALRFGLSSTCEVV